MPYIKRDDREAIKSNVNCIVSFGDLNYAITKVILGLFKETPRYETIHKLRRDFVIDPKHNPLLKKLEADFSDRFSVSDVRAAAAEAFHEFRERVGKLYEAGKCLENGDLPEYEELIGPLFQHLAEIRTKQKETPKIILPNEAK